LVLPKAVAIRYGEGLSEVQQKDINLRTSDSSPPLRHLFLEQFNYH
jgi:hypothetical protein